MKIEEMIIKRKITIGDILVLTFLFVIFFASFFVVLDEGIRQNIGVLILGVLFFISFVLLFPYITYKRPYFKVNSKGVYAKLPEGFGYGSEKFYSWNRIINNINQFNSSNSVDSSILELNEKFIREYINSLKQFMKKADKNINGIISYTSYLGLE